MKKSILLLMGCLALCAPPAPAVQYPESGNYQTYNIIKAYGACYQGLTLRFQRQGIMAPNEYIERYCVCILDDIRTTRIETEFLQSLDEEGEAAIVPHVISCNLKLTGEGPGVTLQSSQGFWANSSLVEIPESRL